MSFSGIKYVDEPKKEKKASVQFTIFNFKYFGLKEVDKSAIKWTYLSFSIGFSNPLKKILRFFWAELDFFNCLLVE